MTTINDRANDQSYPALVDVHGVSAVYIALRAIADKQGIADKLPRGEPDESHHVVFVAYYLKAWDLAIRQGLRADAAALVAHLYAGERSDPMFDDERRQLALSQRTDLDTEPEAGADV